MNSLARDLRRAGDPVALAAEVGLAPDPWQVRVLRSGADRALWNASRQSGKSTLAALLALHQALYTPGSLTLLLSPTQRQSGELFKKVLGMYRVLGRPVPADAETALTLSLENGSRVVSLPGSESTIRGYSGVNLLVIDEASRVPDDTYLTTRPFLAVSGGRLLALSTPFGKRGWWYHAWTGTEAWEREMVTADDVPRISQGFLEEEERTLGSWWFKQEYFAEFMSAATQAFDADDVDALYSEEVEPWAFVLEI